jgi:hypothetical protein
MSEKIGIQDVDGKPISGHYVLRDGIVPSQRRFCSNCTGTGYRLMTSEARRVAANFAKLPELLGAEPTPAANALVHRR